MSICFRYRIADVVSEVWVLEIAILSTDFQKITPQMLCAARHVYARKCALGLWISRPTTCCGSLFAEWSCPF
eukprot:2765443-Amphidinium_carterae.1